jgi:dGTPase
LHFSALFYCKIQELVSNAKAYARSASNYNSSEEFGLLLRKELTSNLVNRLINDIGVVKVTKEFQDVTGTKHQRELGFSTLDKFADGLKKFTFSCINRTNIVQVYEKQGEKIIKGIFDAFNDEAFNKKNLLLPVEFRNNEVAQERRVADYISGMMDSYAIRVFKDLYGEGSLDNKYDVRFFREYKY